MNQETSRIHPQGLASALTLLVLLTPAAALPASKRKVPLKNLSLV